MPSFWENVQVDGDQMDMYVSVPGGSGPFPGVVVIHHGSGIDQFTRDMADKLAGDGFAAAAPDLFHRIPLDSPLRSAPPWERLHDGQIEVDVNATVNFLQGHRSIRGEKLGLVGFCMGGRVVWLMAAANPAFRASAPYYGGNIMVPWGEGVAATPFARSNEIQGAILFHFGVTDANPSQEDMRKLDAELTRLDKDHEFYSYEGAGHSFMDHTNPGDHRPAAVEESWPRTIAFFNRHLG